MLGGGRGVGNKITVESGRLRERRDERREEGEKEISNEENTGRGW